MSSPIPKIRTVLDNQNKIINQNITLIQILKTFHAEILNYLNLKQKCSKLKVIPKYQIDSKISNYFKNLNLTEKQINSFIPKKKYSKCIETNFQILEKLLKRFVETRANLRWILKQAALIESEKKKDENLKVPFPVNGFLKLYQGVFDDAKLHENEFRFSRSQIDEMMQSFF